MLRPTFSHGFIRTLILILPTLALVFLASAPHATNAAPLAGGDPLVPFWSSKEADLTSSLAWGDVDNDGDLDLAVGHGGAGGPNRLYRNEGGTLTSSAVWSSAGTDLTYSIAWGDVDGDGDLDLAAGMWGPNRIFRNDGGTLTTSPVWSSPQSDDTYSVAWGDVDNDGDLDLAAGNYLEPSRVYRNDGVAVGVPQMTLLWTSAITEEAESVAWGDVDGDGNLDLAVGAIASSHVYTNTGTTLTPNPGWSSTETDFTRSLAWGDVDGDGDLDLATGVWGGPNRVYLNTGSALPTSASWSSSGEFGINTTSIALGDYDGDGDLDLVAGCDSGDATRLYRNDGGTLTTSAVWTSPLIDGTTSVAWGDVDGDGDPDLAVGNSAVWGQINRLYRNVGTTMTTDGVWTSTAVDDPSSVAWGDVDNDGDLDLAFGNWGDPNRLYRNNNGTLTASAVWSSSESDYTNSLAWGDVDGDGDLDLAAGNSDQPSRIYRNDGGTLTTSAIWSSPQIDFGYDDTHGVAWGDVDGDGDLDLAVANFVHPNRLYRNDGMIGGVPQMTLVWSSSIWESTAAYSVAWGDVDGDGDLDLATGGFLGGLNRLYRNDRGTLTDRAVWTAAQSEDTHSIAWGDIDGDGDLDIVAGNYGQPSVMYRNDGGTLTTTPVWSSIEADKTTGIALGDTDGDGDLDLALGNENQPDRIYRNDGGTLTANAVWSSVGDDATSGVAWGDVDGDGDLDLATASFWYAGQNRLYRNTRDGRTLHGPIPVVRVARPGPNADLYSSPRTWSGVVPITYTLSDPQSDPVRFVRAWYSADGGGQWFPAVAGSGTITSNLTTTATYAYKWDVLASGFFGQGDNVVFRIQAVPAVVNHAHQVPGPYLYGAHASSTFPFRVRGSQARVLSGTLPISNAIVYHLPAGQTFGAAPFADASGQPFRTDKQGYLQGRGQIDLGDRLIALAPISSTSSYTLYLTNATPNPIGMSAYTVTQAGVQTLTVSAAHPLFLFNLDVSLEWDARQDTAYLNQLQFNFQRASEVLFDITNGQAALGRVTIYHNRELWNDAHILIYANNQLRPFADQGGIVLDPLADPVTPTVVYVPGQLNMGATWNRYGDPGLSLGEDWPRTLAHELGHYLLFLDDNYIGLDENGLLVPVTTCTGSIMSDPYRDDYSELHGPADWDADCANTLSNQTTGRSDWETADTFYPPAFITENTGPILLPLAVTQIRLVDPITPTTTLPDPRFYLTQGGAHVQPGAHAQAYLFRDMRLVNLGRPVLDQLVARGAQPGDRVCVYELEASRLGCKTVSVNDNQQLQLYTVNNWQPHVRVSPVNTVTVNVQVSSVPSGLAIYARLYDNTGYASSPITLTYFSAVGTYSNTFHLSEPVFEASIHIYVNESDPRREVVTDYALGGNPGSKRSGFGSKRSGFGSKRSGFAPVLSSDGQVILYTADIDFPFGAFYTLQAETVLPHPPTWATVIGKGYWLSRSSTAPDLVGASINMGYAQNQVPSGEEPSIRVYFWNGSTWTALPTTVSVNDNSATSPVQGPGLYALMSTIEIPLYAGWNLVPYPVQFTRPVTDALTSIEGSYTLVYAYVTTDTLSPWRVYAPGTPGYVNNLTRMEFGKAYWIYATQAVTLRLTGSTSALSAAVLIDLTAKNAKDAKKTVNSFALACPASFCGAAAFAVHSDPQSLDTLLPPSTFYGPVLSGAGFTPTVGSLITATIGSANCGQSRTLNVGGQIVYTLNVYSDGQQSGCGQPGRSVTFKVGARTMATIGRWDNTRVQQLALSTNVRVYLPLIRKNQ